MRINPEDIIGNRYHKLTVIEYAGKERCIAVGKECGWNHYYICLCDCGNNTKVLRNSLTHKNTKSCGCLRFDPSGDPISKQPEYKVWQGMKGRCNNPNHARYKYYGARGIKVCEQWINSYQCFMHDMGRRPKGLTIERMDNDKGYSPDNCKWATCSEQLRNRRPYTFTRKKNKQLKDMNHKQRLIYYRDYREEHSKLWGLF